MVQQCRNGLNLILPHPLKCSDQTCSDKKKELIHLPQAILYAKFSIYTCNKLPQADCRPHHLIELLNIVSVKVGL